MAKRRVEAVACCALYQPPSFPRAPPSKRSRSDLERRESRAAALWRENGPKKRKWTVVAEGGDEAGSGGKRLAGGTARRREPEQRLPAVAGMATETAAFAGGDATGSQGGPEKTEDDVWRYNSFQFWKLPLPTIDLSDIQELEKASITETRSSSNTSLSEMET